jgi:hypothetical protein
MTADRFVTLLGVVTVAVVLTVFAATLIDDTPATDPCSEVAP